MELVSAQRMEGLVGKSEYHNRTVFEIFEETVRRYPNNIAIEVADGISLDYKTLSNCISSMASRLYFEQLLKPHQNDFVGILLPNGADYIISVGAIMKCRKIFVPLDPKSPLERTRVILEDLGNPILVTTSDIFVDIALKYSSELTLFLDKEYSYKNSDVLPDFKSEPYDIMYCIYTSGSTGEPKGLLIQNYSVVHWILCLNSEFGICPSDRSLAFSNPTFDLSIGQVWPYLCKGATVVFASLNSGCDLHCLVVEKAISVLFLSTIVAMPLFCCSDLKNLRFLLFGGEIVKSINSVILPPHLPFCVVHTYGSTETTISNTLQIFKPGEQLTLSVGRPISCQNIFILDESQEIVPSGTVGEVYIGGIGVSSKGYHNRPNQNEKVFITWRGQRLCRIGDLGVLSQNGSLEITGRIDNQVKVHGIRLELEEVESVLNQHDAVKDSCVVYNKELGILKCFITLLDYSKHENFDKDQVIKFMEKFLPSCVTTSQIYYLDSFPLSSTGKIDKKKLQEWESKPNCEYSDKDVNYGQMVELIATVWSELFRIPKHTLTPTSNFFKLGGTSLQAMAFILRLRSALKWLFTLSYSAVFTHPSIQEFANLVILSQTKNIQVLPLTDAQESTKLPLSFAQEQLWLQDRNGESCIWNMLKILNFKSIISISALQLAINKIMERHQSLRTSIQVESSNPAVFPKQIVQTDTQYSIQSLLIYSNDITSVLKLKNKPFDLVNGPLVRFYVGKSQVSEEHTTLFIVNYHHTTMDGFGWAVFCRELAYFYLHPHDVPLPTAFILSSNFLNTVTWERNQLIDTSSLAFWKSKLDGVMPAVLPNCLTNNHVRESSNIRFFHKLNIDLTDGLINLSKLNETTLFTVLLGVFKVLLSRYTGETDQTIMSLFRSGSSLPGSENLIGHFVNMIPIRTHIAPDEPFELFLKSVKNVMASSLQHSNVSFQQIISAAHLSNSTLNKLLGIMVQMLPEIDLSQTFEEELIEEVGESLVDFGVDFSFKNKTLYIVIEYNPAIFSKKFVQRFVKQYETLCTSIVRFPQVKIKNQNVLPENQKHKILNLFSSSDTTALPENNLIDTFQKQATYNPSAICIVDSKISLTYGDVDAMSTMLANQIYKKINSQNHVCVFLPRGKSFLLSTLALAKLNCTIVLISLMQPQTFVAIILEDLKYPLVITDTECCKLLPENYQNTLYIDDMPQQDFRQAAAYQKVCNESMYCFFTSGSSGIPKGVMQRGISVLNVVYEYIRRLELMSNDRSLFFHNPAFDASLVDFWPALVTGGSVWIPNEEFSYNPSQLFYYIIQNSITHANLPTVVASSIFAKYDDFKNVNTCKLKWMVVGGEKLKLAPPQYFPARCLNAYGPTEATIDSTHVVATTESVLTGSVGKPIANVTTYILDDGLLLVPVGAIGELWIGGIGLAGYRTSVNEEDKSRFRDNPYKPGSQIYRSGDLAFWQENGEISIIGRRDNQVKVNGFRIELESVEAALLSHPLVESAGVVLDENSLALVAFLSTKSHCLLSAETMRTFLKARIPYYAMPRSFHWIEAIPLLNDVKVDRLKLKRMKLECENELVNNFSTVEFTHIESELLCIWRKVLSLQDVEAYPDTTFYEVGGNSLVLGLLVREIYETFSIKTPSNGISFSELIANLSLGKMAQLIKKKMEAHLPLSEEEKKIWFHQEFKLPNEDNMYYHCRVYKILFKTIEIELKIERNVNIVEVVNDFLLAHENTLKQRPAVINGHLTKVSANHKNTLVPIVHINNIKEYLEKEKLNRFDLTGFLDPLVSLFRSEILITSKDMFVVFHWHQILLSKEFRKNIFMDFEQKLSAVAEFQSYQCDATNENHVPITSCEFDNTCSQELKFCEDIELEYDTWLNIISKISSLVLKLPLKCISRKVHEDLASFANDTELLRIAYWIWKLLFPNGSLPLRWFYKHASLSAFAEGLALQKRVEIVQYMSNLKMIPFILERELTTLKDTIVPRAMHPRTEYYSKDKFNLFLTGGTGYLGSFILESLLKDPKIKKVFCLVRGKNPSRLLEVLRKHNIVLNTNKIEIICGDLSLPKFGLDANSYVTLSKQIDTICHCGAVVNLIQSYVELRDANVLGTKEICKFSISGNQKALHYVSTADSAVGQFLFETSNQVMEEYCGPPPYFDIGYYQTKWVSEGLVHHVSKYVPCRVYRVGTVGAHSERNIFNPTSFDGLFLRACVKSKAYPILRRFTVPYSDVDWIADVIHLSMKATMTSSTPSFQIHNTVQKCFSLDDLFSDLNITAMEPTSWYEGLASHSRGNTSDKKLQTLLTIFQQKHWGEICSLTNLFEYITHMPIISYPMERLSSELKLADPNFVIPEPEIGKYIMLHSAD